MALQRQSLISTFFKPAQHGFARFAQCAYLHGPAGGANGLVAKRAGRLVEVVQSCTQITTAGAATYTAEMVLGGIISRDPGAATRTDVLPTAALLYAAFPKAAVGDTIRFFVHNSGTTFPIIVTAGTSGTLIGSGIVGAGQINEFVLRFTAVGSSPTYTVYQTSPTPAASQIQTDLVTIPAADIVSTSAGKLGHAHGQILVAAPGSGKVIEFVGAVLSYTYATAAYTAGGNITINISGGGAALTGLISAANSLGAASDKIVQFVPLAAAAANLTANTGLNLVAAAAFTQPGTAAGTVKVFVSYRVHTL